MEADTVGALKAKQLNKFKGRAKGPSKQTLQRMEFLISKRAKLGTGNVVGFTGNVVGFMADVFTNHTDEVKMLWGDGDTETLISKMMRFARHHLKGL